MNNPLVVCALNDELKIESSKIDLLYTGVGKINAAISITKYLSKRTIPEYVINYGTAGSKTIEVGKIVDCTKFIQRDMDATGLGFKKYETPFDTKSPKIIDFSFFEKNPINLYLTCATGDSFIHSEYSHVGDVVDMEAYALAKVCFKYDIPFISFKFISDGADTDANIDWNKNINNGENLFKSMVLDPLALI